MENKGCRMEAFIGFPNLKKRRNAGRPLKMAVGSRFERKCRKNRNGWEKFRETLNLSGKMTIMDIRNGGNTLDK